MAQRTARLETRTARMRLVALDAELARLQSEDRPAFFAALDAQDDSAWPPDIYDAAFLHKQLDAAPDQVGWRPWVYLFPGGAGLPQRLVGMGGFHGPPDGAGEVELGYAVLPEFCNQGFATEAVEGLLSWAFGQPKLQKVCALIEPHHSPSRRVLEKAGFTNTGVIVDEDGDTVVRYIRHAGH